MLIRYNRVLDENNNVSTVLQHYTPGQLLTRDCALMQLHKAASRRRIAYIEGPLPFITSAGFILLEKFEG